MRLIRNLSEDEAAKARVVAAGITQHANFLVEVKPEEDELKWLVQGAPIYLGQTEGGVFCVVLDPVDRPQFLGQKVEGEGDDEWRPTNAT